MQAILRKVFWNFGFRSRTFSCKRHPHPPRFWNFLRHFPVRDHTNLQSHYQKLSFLWVLMVIWLCWALFRITGDKMGGVHVLCGPHNNQLSATTGILFQILFYLTARKMFKLSRKTFANSSLKAENLQNFWEHWNNLFEQWNVRTIF